MIFNLRFYFRFFFPFSSFFSSLDSLTRNAVFGDFFFFVLSGCLFFFVYFLLKIYVRRSIVICGVQPSNNKTKYIHNKNKDKGHTYIILCTKLFHNLLYGLSRSRVDFDRGCLLIIFFLNKICIITCTFALIPELMR